jgi:hypothetical protein
VINFSRSLGNAQALQVLSDIKSLQVNIPSSARDSKSLSVVFRVQLPKNWIVTLHVARSDAGEI